MKFELRDYRQTLVVTLIKGRGRLKVRFGIGVLKSRQHWKTVLRLRLAKKILAGKARKFVRPYKKKRL